MSKIAILVDSGCEPTDRLKEQLDFHIQPIQFILDGEKYLDSKDSDVDLFYSKIEKTRDFYTQPPLMWDILDRFEKIRDQGYSEIIDIHMSGKLSKVYELSNTAKNMAKGIKIHTIDTQSATGSACLISLKIIELVQKGLSFEEIEKQLPAIRQSTFIQFTVPTLKYLVKNGRIGKAKAFAANIFKLKPILTIDEGIITPVDKVKGLENACNTIVDNAIHFLSSRPHNVALFFGYGVEENNTELEKLKINFMEKFEALGIKAYTLLPNTRLRPTVSCHSGPEVIGVAVYGEKNPIH